MNIPVRECCCEKVIRIERWFSKLYDTHLANYYQAPVIMVLRETQHPTNVASVPHIGRVLHSNELCYETRKSE